MTTRDTDRSLQALFQEYQYVTARIRDESSRLFQSWAGFVLLVTATVALLNSEFGLGNVAIVAPFGIVVWSLLQIVIMTSLRARGEYLRFVERKVNLALGEPNTLEAENRLSVFFAQRDGPRRLTIWPWIYTVFTMLGAALYAGFGVAAEHRIHSEWLKWALPVAMTAAVAVLIVLATWSFQRYERWRNQLWSDGGEVSS